MASPALLRPFSKLLAAARIPSGSSARSKFYVREPPHDKPDWLKVGLTLGTSVFLWIYVSFYSLNVMRSQHSGEE
ncbi:NDUC1 dehydrogenase, partial [Crocuta crocuta]